MRFVVRSIQGKLTAASLALIAVIILISGAVLEVMLRRAMDARLEAELLRHVAAIESVLARAGEDDRAFALAADMSRAAGLRFTLIDADGHVLADSHVEDRRLGGLEDHDSRPEVQMARHGEVGVVKLENDVPARLLEPRWGETALIVAEASLDGVADLIDRARAAKK